MKVNEIKCKTVIGKCGFPSGGWSINPYVGCEHNCVYCYARFMKRFTNHTEPWGNFTDVKTNAPKILEKQLHLKKYREGPIFIGTVTDPYQPLEEKYKLTRKLLEILLPYNAPVSILTKSDLVLRDLDLLKKFKSIEVNFTINTLDEKWKKYTEPNSSSVEERLQAAKKLSEENIPVYAMVGPYWPEFTNPDELFKRFKEVGIRKVFSESFNTNGDNFIGVKKVLKENYLDLLSKFEEILFDNVFFEDFYTEAKEKLLTASKKYSIPVEIFFGQGHKRKFKK
ncbi:MAG: radical SAM protein [Patescibacteria group bacterium]